MAQIPRYTATKGLQVDGRPDTTIHPYAARAVEGLGGQISQIGAMLEERQQRKEDFRDENNARRLELMLTEQYNVGKDNMAEGGVGFHDGFMSKTYGPAVDQFLSGVSPRNRERFSVMFDKATGSKTAEWSTRAAQAERDGGYEWTRRELGMTTDQMASAIATNPEMYDEILKSGEEFIKQSDLPTLERQKMLDGWREMAKVVHVERLIQDDPAIAMKVLGVNPNQLGPEGQFAVLSQAVKMQESGGDPNAVSPVGAIGLYQVMPGTAKEIAKEINDPNYPHGEPEWVVRAYLSRPEINQHYGEFYLRKMLRRYRNDVEAALVAYHSGPGNADKWLAAGRDPMALGPVGRKYAKEVLARIPGSLAAGEERRGGFVEPSHVKFEFAQQQLDRAKKYGSTPGVEGLHPELVTRVQASFAALGVDTVKANSGHRNKAHNSAARGAKGSQHVHGNAIDIDVTGWSKERRVALIQSLSANGIGGIGVGTNIIHADVGPRRSWGYASSSGGAKPPEWARAATDAHDAGVSVAPQGATHARYAGLPQAKRQQLIDKAETELVRRQNEAAKATVTEKFEVRSLMDNELALIRAQGSGSGTFDDTRIANALGEDDYMKWLDRRKEAQKIYVGTHDMKTMTPEHMAMRIEEYRPNPTDVASFASNQRVHEAIMKEETRLRNLRARAPDQAALEVPEVKAVHDKAMEGVMNGEPDPAALQELVRAMKQQQEEFGVPKDAQAPVPRAWAFGIGQMLSGNVPALGSRDAAGERIKSEEIRAAIAVAYSSLRETYGDYADEVIVYALSVYKGVDKDTSGLIESLMGRVSRGDKDPFRLDRAADVEQVEQGGNWFRRTRDFLFGASDADTPEAQAEAETAARASRDAPSSPEAVRRAIGFLNNLDEDDEGEIEWARERYGDAAVDAALMRLGR